MPKAGPRTIKKNEYLFHEGDPSDAMYVIKSGTISITKAKGASEIILAELRPGEMLGEMAFFDNRSRSASAKAPMDAEVICLPFAALHAQFKTFPEWLKAMVKTVNGHLRNANMRIKNLEQVEKDDGKHFTSYLMTRYAAILCLLAHRYGEPSDKGISLPGYILRDYTIQLFHEPTHKMQIFIEILQERTYLTIEDLGEGQTNIVIHDLDFLVGFYEWYNRFLFSKPEKRVKVEETEIPLLRALVYYGEKYLTDDKEEANVNLTALQNESMKDLGYLVKTDDLNGIIAKGLISEKITGDDGLSTKFNLPEMKARIPYWELVYTLDKATKK